MLFQSVQIIRRSRKGQETGETTHSFRSWIDKSHWTSARFRYVSELRLGDTEEEECGLKQ